MARRLSPEARRAEIIAVARAVIAEEGYRALSLREVAHRCGMSAPGLMHYFRDMPSLLAAVLDARDAEEFELFSPQPGSASGVLDIIDSGFEYYSARGPEVAHFDALETEALDPGHPAHDYFVARSERTLAKLRPFVEREFADPEAVIRLLRVVIVGMRLRALRDPEHESMLAQWRAVRDLLDALPRRERFTSCETPRREASSEP